jgi:Holliday junction resolvasome RuvABC endonuclease subunit
MSLYCIGIDPSISNTGIVILNNNCEFINWGESHNLVNKKIIKHCILRYTEITDKIVNLIEESLDSATELVICYEDYSFNSTNKSYSLGELGGVLKTALLQQNIPTKLYLVPPSTLKLFATGYGGATKEMMLEAYKKNTPQYVVPSGDIIDAYYLAEMACYIKKQYPATLCRDKLEVIKKYLGISNNICNIE